MKIKRIEGDFTVCRVADFTGVSLEKEFCFAARTDEECSLVCATDDVPAETLAREDGWRALRVAGQLDFSLIGILADISGALAQAGVSMFAASTYDTDYVLVKENELPKALRALRGRGHTV